jgi:hypothetical protein
MKLITAPIQLLKTPLRDLFDQVRLRPSVRERLLCWVYGPAFRAWCRANPCAEFADRSALYRHLLEHEGLDGPIDYLEFGVAEGTSIRWWVENNRHPGATFVGFDSFEGLPEAWGAWPKGSFATGGQIPEIPDPRCGFVKGLFQDTLPGWIAGHEFARRIVLHLDADLYSSTLVALTQLLPKLKASDVVILDEFPDLPQEYRGFSDATAAYSRRFQALGRAQGWARVALAVIA